MIIYDASSREHFIPDDLGARFLSFDAGMQWDIAWQLQYIQFDEKTLNNRWKSYWMERRGYDIVEPIISNADSVLDVGGGALSVFRIFKPTGRQVIADPAIDIIDYCVGYSKNGIECTEAWVENLPYDDGSFDVVVCGSTIDHVLNKRRAMKEMYRVLRDGGYLLITFNVFDKKTDARTLAHRHTFNQENVNKLLKMFDVVWSVKHADCPSFFRVYMQNKNISSRELECREHVYVVKK